MGKKKKVKEKDYLAEAHGKYLRMSPRKVRLVIDLIRGKDVNEAITILRFTEKRKAASLVEKVLNSAIANATNLFPNVDVDKLYVKKCWVNESFRLKRFKAGPMGRVRPILRRFSHISIYLDERK